MGNRDFRIEAARLTPKEQFERYRELVGDHNLAPANALVQAATIIAILMGTFAFSAGFEWLLPVNYENNEAAIVRPARRRRAGSGLHLVFVGVSGGVWSSRYLARALDPRA